MCLIRRLQGCRSHKLGNSVCRGFCSKAIWLLEPGLSILCFRVADLLAA